MLQLDVIEFASQIKKLGLSDEELVGIANALAISEVPVKGHIPKACMFPYQLFRFRALEEFSENAKPVRTVPEPVGASCDTTFKFWRDKLAETPSKPKSPKS